MYGTRAFAQRERLFLPLLLTFRGHLLRSITTGPAWLQLQHTIQLQTTTTNINVSLNIAEPACLLVVDEANKRCMFVSIGQQVNKPTTSGMTSIFVEFPTLPLKLFVGDDAISTEGVALATLCSFAITCFDVANTFDSLLETAQQLSGSLYAWDADSVITSCSVGALLAYDVVYNANTNRSACAQFGLRPSIDADGNGTASALTALGGALAYAALPGSGEKNGSSMVKGCGYGKQIKCVSVAGPDRCQIEVACLQLRKLSSKKTHTYVEIHSGEGSCRAPMPLDCTVLESLHLIGVMCTAAGSRVRDEDKRHLLHSDTLMNLQDQKRPYVGEVPLKYPTNFFERVRAALLTRFVGAANASGSRSRLPERIVNLAMSFCYFEPPSAAHQAKYVTNVLERPIGKFLGLLQISYGTNFKPAAASVTVIHKGYMNLRDTTECPSGLIRLDDYFPNSLLLDAPIGSDAHTFHAFRWKQARVVLSVTLLANGAPLDADVSENAMRLTFRGCGTVAEWGIGSANSVSDIILSALAVHLTKACAYNAETGALDNIKMYSGCAYDLGDPVLRATTYGVATVLKLIPPHILYSATINVSVRLPDFTELIQPRKEILKDILAAQIATKIIDQIQNPQRLKWGAPLQAHRVCVRILNNSIILTQDGYPVDKFLAAMAKKIRSRGSPFRLVSSEDFNFFYGMKVPSWIAAALCLSTDEAGKMSTKVSDSPSWPQLLPMLIAENPLSGESLDSPIQCLHNLNLIKNLVSKSCLPISREDENFIPRLLRGGDFCHVELLEPGPSLYFTANWSDVPATKKILFDLCSQSSIDLNNALLTAIQCQYDCAANDALDAITDLPLGCGMQYIPSLREFTKLSSASVAVPNAKYILAESFKCQTVVGKTQPNIMRELAQMLPLNGELAELMEKIGCIFEICGAIVNIGTSSFTVLSIATVLSMVRCGCGRCGHELSQVPTWEAGYEYAVLSESSTMAELQRELVYSADTQTFQWRQHVSEVGNSHALNIHINELARVLPADAMKYLREHSYYRKGERIARQLLASVLRIKFARATPGSFGRLDCDGNVIARFKCIESKKRKAL